MKRAFSQILLIITFAVCLSACERYIAPDNTVRRTLLVYMEARNSLSPTSTEDIIEMQRAIIPKDCRVLIYQSANSNPPRLIEIVNGREVVLQQYPDETSAVDPAHLRSVISTAQLLAPAQEYGLILWSHSTGWMQTPMKSRGFGYEYSREQMSISDLADAIKGLDLDFIVFDTCYMACVEVAYELRNAARYMVASVCEVPEDGMPYIKTLPALLSEDMAEGLKEAIDVTVSSYPNFGGCPSTLSLIDLTKMDDLAAAVKDALGGPIPNYTPQVFSTSHPYNRLFFDFGQYFDAIGGDESAKNDAILHERHTSSIWGRLPLTHCSGLSIFIPEFSSGFNYDSYGYSSLEWPQFLNLTN